MWAALAVSLFAVLPSEQIACDRVDLVEVNHVYDAQGKPVLVQAVFYDFRPQQGDYQVRSWRLLKTDDQRPHRDFRRGDWVMMFHDGGLMREVRAGAFRETWTQYDVERWERERLPQEHRVGLMYERQPSW
jgi:hypothetical protein